jgi:DNA polymerase III subunit delta
LDLTLLCFIISAWLPEIGVFVKINDLKTFEKHLKASDSESFSRIYLVNGKDEAEKRNAVKTLQSFLLQGQDSSIFLKTFDCVTAQIGEIMEELEGFSFFGGKPVVLVNSVEKLDKLGKDTLRAYASNPNESVYLLMTAAGLSASTNLYKQVEKNAVVLHLALEKPWEKENRLTEWVAEECRKSGKNIGKSACHHLVRQIGVDMTLLENELEKLISFVGERSEILDRDVGTICVRVPLETVWQLGEAIFQGDLSRALLVTRSLQSEGTTLFSLIPQLRRQFQTGYHICSVVTNGGSTQEITQAFPYMTGRILERNIRQSQNYGMPRFKKGVILINETDVLSKNSTINPDFLLEMLVVKLGTL